MDYQEVTTVWQLYEKGKEHHNRKNMYTRAYRCYKFY